MKYFVGFKEWLTTPKSNYLTRLYFSSLVFVFVASLISFPFKFLIYCPNIDSLTTCLPIVMILGLAVSSPGYFLVGLFAKYLDYSTWSSSLYIVLGVNLVIYFLIGIISERSHKFTIKKLTILFLGISMLGLIIGTRIFLS